MANQRISNNIKEFLLLGFVFFLIFEFITCDKGKYWVNDDNYVRHNKSCKYYGKSQKGHYSDEINEWNEIPCRRCGG